MHLFILKTAFYLKITFYIAIEDEISVSHKGEPRPARKMKTVLVDEVYHLILDERVRDT